MGASTGAARVANEKKMIETAAVATLLGVGTGVIGAVAAKAAAPLVARALQRMTGATPEPPRTLSGTTPAEPGPYKPGAGTTADGETFTRSPYSGGTIDTTPAPGDPAGGITTTPIEKVLPGLSGEGGSVSLGMVDDVISGFAEHLGPIAAVGSTAILYATDPKKATGELISSFTFSGSLGDGDEYTFHQPPAGKRPIGGPAK